jgi:predicted nucleic acid-binding protein
VISCWTRLSRSSGFLKTKRIENTAWPSLASLSEKRALVPLLWFYEVGNGLLMACRRKRISVDQVDGFLTRLKALPIEAAQQAPSEILELPALAQANGLTNYDAAYVAKGNLNRRASARCRTLTCLEPALQ